MPRNLPLSPYDELTDNSAAILGVAIPFPENSPLDNRQCGEQRENEMSRTRMETLRSPSTGLTRRTSIGKRWLVIYQQDEQSRCWMLTFTTEEEASRINDGIYRTFRPDVHFVEQAQIVSKTSPERFSAWIGGAL